MFKTYQDKKNIDILGKNPNNYEGVRDETPVHEQKPIKIDEFNKAEEKEVKERIEKRKIKRREVAEKSKLPKRKEKTRRKQKNWKSNARNKVFKDIREKKRRYQKCLKY